MNGVETLRSAFRAAHTWYGGTVADVTDEQANQIPPGKCHSIAELAAHVPQSEDWVIQQLLQGKEMLWDSGDWAQQTGVPSALQLTEDTENDFQGSVTALGPYTEAVFGATDAYIGGLTDAELDREIDMSAFGMDNMRLGEVLTMLPLGNTFAHTGEISAIKGTQGAQGYPF